MSSGGEEKKIPLRIRLPFATEDEFIQRYGVHLTRGGLFIATRATRPVGTQLSFEVVLSGGARLMRGEGVVQAESSDGASGRIGMQVRLTRVDAATKALLERVLAARAGPPTAPPATAQPSAAAGPGKEPLPEHEPTTGTPAQDGPPSGTPTTVTGDPVLEPSPAGNLHGPGQDEPTAPDGASPGAPLGRVATHDEPRPVLDSPSPAGEAGEQPGPTPAPARESQRLPEAAPRLPTGVPGDDAPLGIDLGARGCRACVILDGAPRPVLLGAGPAEVFPASVTRTDTAGAWRAGEGPPGTQTVPAVRLWLAGRHRAPSLSAAALGLLREEPAGPGLDEVLEAGPGWVALVLREVAAAAAVQFGREFRRVVLTVPARATATYRQRLLEAARLAGLEPVRLVDTPTAVALAFSAGRGLARKRSFVLALGETGVDAAVAELTGDDVEVTSAGGVSGVGGLELDVRLAGAVLASTPEPIRSLVAASGLAQGMLRRAVRDAREHLCTSERATLEWAGIVRAAGGSESAFTTELTRAWVTEQGQPHLQQILATVRAVLEAARIGPGAIDEILSFGAPCGAGGVEEAVTAHFGRPWARQGDVAAAQGAAWVGYRQGLSAKGKKSPALSEVLAAPIGYASREGGVERVFEQNTRRPARKAVLVTWPAGSDGRLLVYQGTEATVAQCEFQGVFQAPAGRSGSTTAHFQLAADGTLSVEAEGGPGRAATGTWSTAELPEESELQALAGAPAPTTPPVAEAPRGLLSGFRRLFGR